MIEKSDEAMSEIIKTAKAYLSGEIDMFACARLICGLSYKTVYEMDKIFHPFIAIHSDADDFAIGEWRSICSAEYLKRTDADMEDYRKHMTPYLTDACNEIIERFGPLFPSAKSIETTPEALTIVLSDRTISIPWERASECLKKASEFERMYAILSPDGYGIHWPELDEDLSIHGLVRDFGLK